MNNPQKRIRLIFYNARLKEWVTKLNKKNILHVFGTMDYGGAELRTIEVMDSLRGSFNKVYFCTTSGTEGKLANSLKQKGYQIIPCNIYSITFPFKFIRLLRKNNIDIVHSHISLVSGYIVILAFLARIKGRIVHFRSANISKRAPFFLRIRTNLFKVLILIFSTNILAVNNYTMKNHYKNHKKINKCSTIYNGIPSLYDEYNDEVKVGLGLHKHDKVIIHIGRFNKPKNHKKIISVFNEYKKLQPNSKLFLIGNYKTEIGKEIKCLIKHLKLKDDIHILGVQHDISEFLSISDVLLFPSLWEGLPGVVLEALSAGIPVLCSDIGSNAEIAKTNMGINLMSLNEDDLTWAIKLQKVINGGKQEAIASNFKESPYYIMNAMKEFEEFYSHY